VKQSIYFYVYISYNKNISYIVTVTLRPGDAPQQMRGQGDRGPGAREMRGEEFLYKKYQISS